MIRLILNARKLVVKLLLFTRRLNKTIRKFCEIILISFRLTIILYSFNNPNGSGILFELYSI